MSYLVSVTRVYRFSAAHRLYSPHLSDAENTLLYGKCSNPKGHGHNYVIEVSIRGEVNPTTGRVCAIQKLDEIVNESIVQPWDHRNLDKEIPEFKETFSTAECIAEIIWRKLAPKILEGNLERIKVSETQSSSFEYYNEASDALRLNRRGCERAN